MFGDISRRERMWPSFPAAQGVAKGHVSASHDPDLRGVLALTVTTFWRTFVRNNIGSNTLTELEMTCATLRNTIKIATACQPDVQTTLA